VQPRLLERQTPPPGLRYEPELLTPAEERLLLEHVRGLAFSDVKMRGQVARRRTVHFGWLYGYATGRIEPGPPIPAPLLPFRDRAAGLGGVAPEELVEVLVTEYPPDAGIGWHLDKWMFGVVIGVSLLGPCRMRFRHRSVDTSNPSPEMWTQPLEPRSAYVLAGAARWDWEHSIPPSRNARYSITYRTLRPDWRSTRLDHDRARPILSSKSWRSSGGR